MEMGHDSERGTWRSNSSTPEGYSSATDGLTLRSTVTTPRVGMSGMMVVRNSSQDAASFQPFVFSPLPVDGL